VCPRRFPPHHRINDDARAALDDLIELSRTIWGVYDVPEVLVCKRKNRSHTNFYIQPDRTKRSLYIITSAAEDDYFNWTNFMGV
jgi:hypothetical protein